MKFFLVSITSVALFLTGPIATAASSDLVDNLLISIEESCDDIGIEKEHLLKILNALTAEIISQSRRGKQVHLDGFGTFYSEHVMKSQIPVRSVVHFKAHNANWVHAEQPQVTYVLTNW